MYTGGECPRCGETIREGEEIRADGEGSYEHRDCVGLPEDSTMYPEFEPFEEIFEKG